MIENQLQNDFKNYEINIKQRAPSKITHYPFKILEKINKNYEISQNKLLKSSKTSFSI
jgi:hypothetical protein